VGRDKYWALCNNFPCLAVLGRIRSLRSHVCFGELEPFARQRSFPEPNCPIVPGGDQRVT
jgi:hypothetical protein